MRTAQYALESVSGPVDHCPVGPKEALNLVKRILAECEPEKRYRVARYWRDEVAVVENNLPAPNIVIQQNANRESIEKVCDILNEQDARIKELESDNALMKRCMNTSPTAFAIYNGLRDLQ